MVANSEVILFLGLVPDWPVTRQMFEMVGKAWGLAASWILLSLCEALDDEDRARGIMHRSALPRAASVGSVSLRLRSGMAQVG